MDRGTSIVTTIQLGLILGLLFGMSVSLKSINAKLTTPEPPKPKVIECEVWIVPEPEPVRVVSAWDGFI